MGTNDALIKTFEIPADQRKKTTIQSSLSYDRLELYGNRIIGYLNGQQMMTWFFKDYNGIDVVNANMNSQFAQIVFLTGVNSQNRVVGPDLGAQQNRSAMKDTNKILFCSGMFSFKKTNDFANIIASEIRPVFEGYKNNGERENESNVSAADEIKKFKELLDSGIITQEEFDAKKKQLLGL